MENAEIYMLLLRKTTMLPVVGEYLEPGPFIGQIVLDGWSYDLGNEDSTSDDAQTEGLESLEQRLERARRLSRQGRQQEAIDILTAAGQAQDRNVQSVSRRQGQAEASSRRGGNSTSTNPAAQRQQDRDERNAENMTFKFSKTLDTATTQMLMMMKGGVPFQTAVITVVHRAGFWKGVPGFLTIMLQDLKLEEYELSCQQDESNTEMKEEWSGRFKHITFKYFRRQDAPSSSTGYRVHQGLMDAQGAVMFVMKPRLTSV